MKKILMVLSALTVMASADYEIFKSQNKTIGTPVNTEIVYDGDYGDFISKMKEGGSNAMKVSLIAGVTMGAGAAGVHGLIALADPFIMGLHDDQRHLRVLKLTDRNGNVAIKKIMIICDKNPSLNNQEIKNILKGK